MSTTQCKALKKALIKIGAEKAHEVGARPSVRTETKTVTYNGVKCKEYGNATSVVSPLTDFQISQLKELLPLCAIVHKPEQGFTYISY